MAKLELKPGVHRLPRSGRGPLFRSKPGLLHETLRRRQGVLRIRRRRAMGRELHAVASVEQRREQTAVHLAELAAVEMALHRLISEQRKAQKRVNALKYNIIPT